MVKYAITMRKHIFHDMSPYDEVGGAIKREAAKASLRAATSDQILTPEELYNWAKGNIAGVTILYVTIEAQYQVQFAVSLQWIMHSAWHTKLLLLYPRLRFASNEKSI